MTPVFWLLVWVYALPSPAGPDEKYMAFSNTFDTYEDCEKMATMAPMEPNIVVIEPHAPDAIYSRFVCVPSPKQGVMQ